MKIKVFPVLVLIGLIAVTCSKERKLRRDPLLGGPYPSLLVSQAQFMRERDEQGKTKFIPGPARMIILRETTEGWEKVVVDDPTSNVFHKAMVFETQEKKNGILTIGAEQAALKIWRWEDSEWVETLLWQPSFGGEYDRLRDVEVGDVTGDGQPEIVIATHDQGVVAVLMKIKDRWEPTEIDRQGGTFVHEIEIGDVDGDGVNEFFTTPSEPNKASGLSQPGKVVMYRWNGKGFDKVIIEDLKSTHAKEILVADMDRNGTATLFSVLEAERVEDERGTTKTVAPVRIKRYTFKQDGVVGEVIGTLDDYQCRFLCAGDINRDGLIDLVAAGMKSGLWIFWGQKDKLWKQELIDKDSGGFEHSILIADLDENGQPEIYVAADAQRSLRRYRYNGRMFLSETIMSINEDEITWNLMAGRF